MQYVKVAEKTSTCTARASAGINSGDDFAERES